jgi:hypothetical protein
MLPNFYHLQLCKLASFQDLSSKTLMRTENTSTYLSIKGMPPCCNSLYATSERVITPSIPVEQTLLAVLTVLPINEN